MSILGDIFGFIGSGQAAGAISNSNIDAEHGVLRANDAAQQNIQGSIANTTSNVNSAVGNANDVLAQLYNTGKNNAAPLVAAGAQGANGLMNYAASNPQFSFNPTDLQNDPGYKFQLDQGTQAIQSNLAAQGIGNSGSALKELTQYGQGLAGTYYQQAFDRAHQSFQTNQSTTLANLQALIGAGEVGNSQSQAAGTAFGVPIAQNGTNAAEYLGSLGLQGNEAAGQMGINSSVAAGNFAVGAGNARAGGILGQWNNLGNLGSDIANLAGSVH